MESSKSIFSYFEPCVMSPILMGNHTYMNVFGKGYVDMGVESSMIDWCSSLVKQYPFHLSNNLWWSREDYETYEPNLVIIRNLESREVIYARLVDHAS